jgi:hypothetical protein
VVCPSATVTADPSTVDLQKRQISASRGSVVTDECTQDRDQVGGLTATCSVRGWSQQEDHAAGASSHPMLTLAVPLPAVRFVEPRMRLVVAPRYRYKERHRQSKRLIVDDFGDAVAVQVRCPSCLGWRREDGRSNSRCRRCLADEQWLRRRTNPEGSRVTAAEWRRLWLERDPEARRKERERRARAVAQERERDLEGFLRKKREASRRYRDRLRRDDPDGHLRQLELSRIRHRMFRERNGLPVTPVRERVSGTTAGQSHRYVPSAPLVPLLERVCSNGGLKVLAEKAGVTERLLFSWRVGERRYATWDAVDAVLVALERMWWELFDPADATPCETFSGVRSRDIGGWMKAAEMALALWEPQPAVGERVSINRNMWVIESWDRSRRVFWLRRRIDGERASFTSEWLEDLL